MGCFASAVKATEEEEEQQNAVKSTENGPESVPEQVVQLASQILEQAAQLFKPKDPANNPEPYSREEKYCVEQCVALITHETYNESDEAGPALILCHKIFSTSQELMGAIRQKLLIEYNTYKFTTYQYEDWKDESFVTNSNEVNGKHPNNNNNTDNSTPKKRLSQTPLLGNTSEMQLQDINHDLNIIGSEEQPPEVIRHTAILTEQEWLTQVKQKIQAKCINLLCYWISHFWSVDFESPPPSDTVELTAMIPNIPKETIEELKNGMEHSNEKLNEKMNVQLPTCKQILEDIVQDLKKSLSVYSYDSLYVEWLQNEIQRLENLREEKQKWHEYIQQEQAKMKMEREIQKNLLRGYDEPVSSVDGLLTPNYQTNSPGRTERAITSPHLNTNFPYPTTSTTPSGVGTDVSADLSIALSLGDIQKPRSTSMPANVNREIEDKGGEDLLSLPSPTNQNSNGTISDPLPITRKRKKSSNQLANFYHGKKDKATAKEYANQLTLMDFELFLKIHPQQYLYKIMDKGSQNQSKYEALKLLIDRFQKLHQYVVVTIVGAKSLANRVQLIEFFIYIAEYLLKLNNFYSFMSICSGLDSVQVRKLTICWSYVGTSCQRKFDQFLQPICSTNKNYQALRKYIANCNPPAIPFLGIVLTDLTFINDGFADRDQSIDGHINFTKCLKFYQAFKNVIRLTSYDLHPPAIENVSTTESRISIDETKPSLEDIAVKKALENRLRTSTIENVVNKEDDTLILWIGSTPEETKANDENNTTSTHSNNHDNNNNNNNNTNINTTNDNNSTINGNGNIDVNTITTTTTTATATNTNTNITITTTATTNITSKGYTKSMVSFFDSIPTDAKMQSEIETDLDLFKMLEGRIIKALTIQANKIDESEKAALEALKHHNRRSESRGSLNGLFKIFKSEQKTK